MSGNSKKQKPVDEMSLEEVEAEIKGLTLSNTFGSRMGDLLERRRELQREGRKGQGKR